MAEYGYTPDYLTRKGTPWFPVMGEIHYSRYPQKYWKESLCKMKAGGVDIVSAYVIWIHHEEIEGSWDFSDSRDLRAFVAAVRDCGLKMLLRIGPWCHGEVRNGGFPDWLLKKDFASRTNDERYFEHVEKWYSKIYSMVSAYLATDENPENTIIGVQIENEYGHCGGLWGEEGELHMKRLTEIALKCGFKVPLYTATGWGGAVTAGLLPVMGGYCDAPWDQRITEIEPSGNYIFTHERNDHNIGSDYGFGHGITFDIKKFPYLTAELGGGLQMTWHRRTVATSQDIGAMTLVKLGSGVNLLGYYMYHGGTNPEGKLTTLQESKATGSINDLPVKSYDFRAPVREYGQISETFRELKLFTYFVHDYNEELCRTKAFIPEDNPLKPADLENLRYSFRSDGKGGWLFVNNYVRRHHMAEHDGVNITVPEGLSSDPCTFSSLDVKDRDYFFLPFNRTFSGIPVKTARVSPFCRIKAQKTDARQGEVSVFYARRNETDFNGFFQFSTKEPVKDADILVLSREDALNAWKTSTGGLLITEGTLIQNEFGEDIITGTGEMRFAVYPPLAAVPAGFVRKDDVSKNLCPEGKDFRFAVYEYIPDDNGFKGCVCISDVSAASENERKIYKVDISSIVNHLKNESGKGLVKDCFIRFFYEGNTAALYAVVNGERRLLSDDFFSGRNQPWEIGLKRYLSLNTDFSALELEIEALDKRQAIYFEDAPDFKGKKLCRLNCTGFQFEWSCRL